MKMTTKKHEDRIYDLRTLEFSLANGKMRPTDYEKYLKSLPDEEGNFDIVDIEEESEPAEA
jgi:hypothetical protein